MKIPVKLRRWRELNALAAFIKPQRRKAERKQIKVEPQKGTKNTSDFPHPAGEGFSLRFPRSFAAMMFLNLH